MRMELHGVIYIWVCVISCYKRAVSSHLRVLVQVFSDLRVLVDPL